MSNFKEAKKIPGQRAGIRPECSRGSVLVTVAILVPVFILVTGLVTDIGRALTYKEELSKACMIAAEESTKCIDMGAAENTGINKLAGDYQEIISGYFVSNLENPSAYKINYLDHRISGSFNNPKYIEVFCEAEVPCYFLKIISIEKINIHATANGRLRRIR
ncbi:MAG: Tad domain-containing protein [Actinobacteria bacterium]|nr:Tad domain-containing protein [Actinomycetota bacterium]